MTQHDCAAGVSRLSCCNNLHSPPLLVHSFRSAVQAIADELFSEFVSEEVDKVEMVYTKFQSLVKSDPVVQSMLPLLPAGDMCDIDGNCLDPADVRSSELHMLAALLRRASGACCGTQFGMRLRGRATRHVSRRCIVQELRGPRRYAEGFSSESHVHCRTSCSS